jgi:histidinol-phosphate aminotransferase
MSEELSASLTALSEGPSTRAISRRQWLVTSGLSAAATVALPTMLPAMTHAGTTDFSAHAHAATAARRAAGPIRLCFNENPFGMSPKAKASLIASWDEHNKYDPPALAELGATFAKHIGVDPDCVLVTQGSGEVLDIAALAYGMHGGEIVTAWPTFEGLPRYAESIGARVHKVSLTGSLDQDLEAMDTRTTNNVDLVFFCNPNNPTGVLADSKKARDFVSSVSRRAVVLVDEAYHDFVDEPGYHSMVDLVKKGENVIVSRTASKIHALAGLRIGFAVARPDIIARLAQHATGTPNSFGMRAAIASINDTEYQSFVRKSTLESRALLTKTLTGLGKRVAPSQTNFVFFHVGMPVATVQKAMLDKGFIVGRAFPPYNDWCRVSIGTPDEMKAFVAALPAALKA